jgi:uncharacterized protein (TIGR02266 family)
MPKIMNPETKNDRRKFPRYFVRILVDYKSVDSFLYDYSNDLSEGGVFIQTTSPLNYGEQVDLRFTLPGTDRLFQLRGEVVWVYQKQENAQEINSGAELGDALDDLLDGASEQLKQQTEEEGQNLPEGMGIRFTNVTPEEQSLLRDFLHRKKY